MNYLKGPDVDSADIQDLNMTEAIVLAKAADFVVACIGEDTYTEKPGDIDDLALATGQNEVHTIYRALYLFHD